MAPDQVRVVGIVGTGVIGGGWAAHFLRMGYDVVAHDPGPDARARLDALVDNAWPALERLGQAPGAARDRLRFAPTLREAVARADVVQESTPERLPLKVEVLAQMTRRPAPGWSCCPAPRDWR